MTAFTDNLGARKSASRKFARFGRKALGMLLAVTLVANLFAAYAVGTDGIFSAAAATYSYPPANTNSVTYVPSVGANSVEGAVGENFASKGDWNFNFEASGQKWTTSGGATYLPKEGNERLTHTKMSTTNYSDSHELFHKERNGYLVSFDNGNYMLRLKPSDNGNKAVTVTQTLTDLDPRYTYRIGAYVKSIGVGTAYMMAGAPSMTAANADDDAITYINSNLSTWGNGLDKWNGANDADDWRTWATQYAHYTTVYAKPDSNGRVTITFYAYTDAATDTSNQNKYAQKYQVFVDNLDIRVSEAPTATAMYVDVKYYDYSYMEKELARFFEFTWADEYMDGKHTGAHSALDQGLVSGVLDENGNIVFIDSKHLDAYNVEYHQANGGINKSKEDYLKSNADPQDSYKITADLLNGKVAGVDGLFRGQSIDSTLTFYEQADGSYIYDSTLVGHMSDCAMHGYASYSWIDDVGDTYTGGFFPLCDTCLSAEGVNHNFHFGMTMESPFLVDYDEHPNDYTLKFAGDDDFWLFVDGVLLLDGGGAHRPLEEASINLNTNTIVITEFDRTTPTVNANLYETAKANLQKAYGSNTDAINAKLVELFGTSSGDSKTKLKEGYHTFKVFYMERCTEASDLQLIMNLGMESISGIKRGWVLDNNNRTDSSLVYVGDVVEYEFDITNSGDPSLGHVNFSDTLPTGLELLASSGVKVEKVREDGSVESVPANRYSITTSPTGFTGYFTTMEKRETIRLTFRAKVTDAAVDVLRVQNVAQVEETKVPSDEFEVVPNLTVTKDVISGNGEYKPGDWAKYQATFENDSTTALKNILVTDSRSGIVWPEALPEGFYWQDGKLYISSLVKGSPLTITYDYRVTEEDYQLAKANNGQHVNVISGSATYKDKPVYDEDDAVITIGTPATGISVDKTVAYTQNGSYGENVVVAAGDTVWFKLVVTNDSDVTLKNVEVRDEVAGFVTTIDSIAPHATAEPIYVEYTVPANASARIYNVVVATAVYDGNTLTGTDDATVDIFDLAIEKTVNPGSETVSYGQTAYFTIKVTNTGSVDLRNVALTDSLVGTLTADGDVTIDGSNAVIAYLPVGASQSFTFAYTATEADARVGSVKNTATATANNPGITDGSGYDKVTESKTVTDDAVITVLNPTPALKIEKKTSLSDNSGFGESVIAAAGRTVFYQIAVTNIGDVALTGVALTDDKDVSYNGTAFAAGSVITTFDLAIGETKTFVVSSTIAADHNITQQIVNTATAAVNYYGRDIVVSDDAKVDFYGLAIDKTVLSVNGDETAVEAVYGSTVRFGITVTNTGSVALANVKVTDDHNGTFVVNSSNAVLDGGAVVIRNLAVGATETVYFDYVITSADAYAGSVKNIATAVYGDPSDPTTGVKDDDDADVVTVVPNPAISLEKLVSAKADGEYSDDVVAKPGDTVYYKFIVTNTGDTVLTDVAVIDALITAGHDSAVVFAKNSLAVGESVESQPVAYVIPADTDPATKFTNTASVTAKFDDRKVTDSDSANAALIGLAIDKSLLGTSAQVGETKGFQIKVTNTGSIDLTGVRVTDSLPVKYNGKTYQPGEVITTMDLAVGESKTIQVDYTVTEEDVIFTTKTNVAYAEVDDPNDPENPIKVDDDAELKLVAPVTEVEIIEEVSLTGNPNDFHEIVAARPGDTVYFRVYVVNKSDVTLKNLDVTDKLVAELAHTIDSLVKGESSEPVIKPYVIPADADISEIIPNAATVTVEYNGSTLTDTDGAAVELYAIDLEKTALTASAAVGEQVAFNIRVTNTGRATLTNVEVTDSRNIIYNGVFYTAGDVFATIDTLAAGEFVDFTVYYNVTLGDMAAGSVINNATAVSVVFEDGEDVRTVSDTDDASVPLTGTAYSPLSIVKDIVGAREVMPGESVQFSITVKNEGAATYTNLYVQDPFLGKTWIIPTLGPKESYTILSEQTIYNVDAEALPGVYTNIAYLDNDSKFDENDPSSYIDEDDEDFIVKNDPSVEITKVANVSVTNRGNTVIYTLTVANTGNCELVNVKLTDSRDVTYNGTYVPAGEVITTIASIARGKSASIEVSHVIPGDAPINAAYKNIASVEAEDLTGTTVTDDDDVDVTVDESAAPALQVEKWVDKSEGIPGDKVNFYFTVTNTGEAPLTDIQVSDEMIATGFADPIALPVSWNAVFEALEAISIDPGKTWKSPALPYTLPETIDGTIFTNTVTVTAFNPNAADPTDPAERLSDSDDAKVSIKKTFALDITKDVSRSVVEPGTDVVYTIIVTNTGNATLYNVEVSDEMLQNAGCTPNEAEGWPVVIDVLEPNASKYFTVDYTVPYNTVVGTTIKNIAVAKAENPDFPDDPAKELVDSDDADVTVVENIAELDNVLLDKTVNTEFALPGQSVIFTIKVTNNSNEILKNLVVYDPMLRDLVVKCAELKPGEVWTIIDEVDTAWTMPEDAIAGSEYVNTAYLFKERQFDQANPDISKAIREDDAVVRTDYVPGIRITKTANVSVVNRGSEVLYTLVVENTGNCALENVKITDSRAVTYKGVSYAAGEVIATTTLAVGESKSYTVAHTIPGNAPINKYYTNIAYVEADHPDGNSTLKDDDDVDVFVSESPAPALQVSKWVDKAQAIPGDKVNFYFSVTNTGEAPLTDIEVTDIMVASTLEGAIDISAWNSIFADLEGRELAPGEVWTSAPMAYTIPEVVDGTVFDNDVTVTAFNPNAVNPDDPAERLSDSDDAQVKVVKTFAIDIVKDVDKQTAEPGDKVLFTIVVTNTGDTALKDVELTDPLLRNAGVGAWPIKVGALQPGEAKSYTMTYTVPYSAEVGSLIKNVAYVTAPNPDFPDDPSKTLEDEDDANVTVIDDNGNDIQLTKTVNKDFANPGETVYFTITVYNNSNEDWNNLVVYDPMLKNLVVERSLLKPGETWTIVGDETAFTIPRDAAADSSYLNTAYLFKARQFNKSNPNLDKAIRQDDALVRTNYIPGIEIIKTANVQMVNRGDIVTYTLTVNNIGNCALTNVEITDNRDVTFEGKLYKAGEVITTIDELAIGESTAITVTHEIPGDAKLNANYKNIAEVTAPHPEGGSNTDLTDDDDADVFVSESPAPALQVEKWVDKSEAIPGDKVNFYFSVTNTGEANLTDLKVTDVMTATTVSGELELPADWAAEFAKLEGTEIAPGETWYSDALEYTVPELVDGTTVLNVVTVTAFNPNAENPDDPAERLTDSDDAQFDIHKTFALDIDKTVSRELVEPGTDVVYTIVVTNIGDTDLYNVEVTDPMLKNAGCGSWPYVIDELKVGKAEIITVDYTVPYGAEIGSTIDNVAYATAPNPDFPDDPSKDITVDDDAEITIIDEMEETDDIILTKTVNKSYADPGETVIFTINVYNNSSIVWKNLVVFDPMLGNLTVEKDRLQPGETWTIIGQETAFMIPEDALAGQEFVNTAYLFKARQFDEEAPDLNKAIREDNASVITNFIPGVTLTKVADRTLTEPKETVYYSILVTNTGNCELKNLVVEDTLGGEWLLDETNANVSVNAAGEVVIGALAAGAGEVLSYSYVVPEDSETGDIIENTATVTAPNPIEGEEPLTDDDVAYVTVLIPGLEVTKTANTESALPGTTIDYTITVTNVGETTLEQVVVTDIKDVTYEGVLYPAGDPIVTIETLEPGDCFVLTGVTYTIADDAAAYSIITNTATATDNKGITDSGSDNVVVEPVPEPEEPEDDSNVLDSSDYSDYNIVKTASVSEVALGESVTYIIKVSNTGSMDLANVAVTDSLPVTYNGKLYEANEVIHTYPVLRAGETKTLVVTYDVPEDAKTGDLVNIATMKPEGRNEKEDEAIVRTYSDDQPGYKIMKVSDMTAAAPGTVVNFYLTVTNTGNCVLTDLVVSDPILNYTYTIPSLDPGATWRSGTGELTYTVPAGTENGTVFNNTAYVTGVLGTMEESNVVGVTANNGVLGSLSTVNPSTADDGAVAAATTALGFSLAVLIATIPLMVISSKKRNSSFGN